MFAFAFASTFAIAFAFAFAFAFLRLQLRLRSCGGIVTPVSPNYGKLGGLHSVLWRLCACVTVPHSSFAADLWLFIRSLRGDFWATPQAVQQQFSTSLRATGPRLCPVLPGPLIIISNYHLCFSPGSPSFPGRDQPAHKVRWPETTPFCPTNIPPTVLISLFIQAPAFFTLPSPFQAYNSS